MVNKLLTVIGLALIVAGAAVAAVTGYQLTQLTGLAVTMFGAGLAVNQLWNSKKEGAKTWLVIMGIALVGLGSFIAGLFLLMDIEQIKTFIGFIFAVIVFIAGLVVTYIGNKMKKKQ